MNFGYRTLERESRSKDVDGIKVEFSVEGSLNVLPYAEAVLLSRKQQVTHGGSLAAERVHHDLSLIRRDDHIFFALEEDYRNRKPVGVG